MIHMNLGSHDGRTIEELTSLVEQVCDSTSTEVSTERAAFTSSAAASREMSTNSVAANRSSGLTQSGAEFPCSGETTAQLDRDEQEGASQCSPSRSVSQSDPQIHLPKREFPLPCHGANQAYDAGVESFQNQFGGEEE